MQFCKLKSIISCVFLSLLIFFFKFEYKLGWALPGADIGLSQPPVPPCPPHPNLDMDIDTDRDMDMDRDMDIDTDMDVNSDMDPDMHCLAGGEGCVCHPCLPPGHCLLFCLVRSVLLRSFKGTFTSFPLFFWVFGDLWDPKERSILFRKECKVLLQRM